MQIMLLNLVLLEYADLILHKEIPQGRVHGILTMMLGKLLHY